MKEKNRKTEEVHHWWQKGVWRRFLTWAMGYEVA
jgi:hypothetical protein